MVVCVYDSHKLREQYVSSETVNTWWLIIKPKNKPNNGLCTTS